MHFTEHHEVILVNQIARLTNYWYYEWQGDHVALLSAFAEMGLKLRMDLPEQAMEVTTVFFRNSTPASEAAVSIGFGVKVTFFIFVYKTTLTKSLFSIQETLKNFSEERAKKLKALQEKMQLDDKEVKRFNPVSSLGLNEWYYQLFLIYMYVNIVLASWSFRSMPFLEI